MSRKQVCIQGLGFVGSAMAVAIASARSANGEILYDTVGVDVDSPEGIKRVSELGQGRFPFATTDKSLSERTDQCVRCGNLTTTTDSSVYALADIIVVDIPLNIDYTETEPSFDLSGFSRAFRSLTRIAKQGALILIESTVPPGTCDQVLAPILQEEMDTRGLAADAVHLAHSYERVMPGKDYLASITHFWRVYAANSDAAAEGCEKFLSSIIDVETYPLTRLSSMTASETAKVMENTYRAANIAFMDEWTKFAETVGIDLFEVTSAIRIRPTHSNIRYPGLGVGGYCLTKDPAFAPAAARQLFGISDLEFPFIELLSEVNQSMPLHAVARLSELLGGSCEDKNILLCGVSYRGGVGDTRFSPVETFARELRRQGASIQACDPYVSIWPEMEEEILSELPVASGLDAIIFTTGHTEFRQMNLIEWLGVSRPLVLDAVNVISNRHRKKCREVGIRVESIGRGTGL